MSQAKNLTQYPTFYLLISWFIITVMWWAIAFAPLNASPEWLLTARSVCFGTLANGLPDSYGWLKLVLGPLPLLLGIYIVWCDEVRNLWRPLIKTSFGNIILVLVSAVLIFGGVFVGKRLVYAQSLTQAFNPTSSEKPIALPQNYPRTYKPAPEFNLKNQLGNDISLKNMRGQIIYLTFVFAHCQTICPTILHQAKRAMKKATQTNRTLLAITLDPWRDTPGALPALAKEWKLGEKQYVLSGSVKEVNRVLDGYNVPRDRDLKNGNISHPALVYVIDTKGNIAYTFNSPSPQWLIEAGNRIEKENL